jgi:hypothetical protein
MHIDLNGAILGLQDQKRERKVMPDVVPIPRTLRVFVASPSDVAEERVALRRLICDINDVLSYLDPARNLRIELVGYETDSYPDYGSPQDVINRQIPVDYDIFIGIMWKRCGTPTKSAPSGTIEEYRRACEKRKQGGLPRVMFYFCDQPIAIPSKEELVQLEKVIEFRREVNEIGLTSNYPSHAEFIEHVRGGLLRAIRDILQDQSLNIQPEQITLSASTSAGKARSALDNAARTNLARLAGEYESIRASMPSGWERTREMAAVFAKMKACAPDGQGLLDELMTSSSPGMRLAAVAILQMFPKADTLDWLATRLDNPDIEMPFVGYQAAVALAEAVRALPTDDCPKVEAAFRKAKALAAKLAKDSDRLTVLQSAEAELKKKCSGSTS